MTCPASAEIKRQSQVARQMCSMHSMLRDEYLRKAIAAELVLLVAAVIFCATTFAGEGLYLHLGVRPGTGRIVLGLTSVLAFAASLCVLVLDWRGRSARHGEAADHWAAHSLRYRKLRQDESSEWTEEARRELDAGYAQVAKYSVSVPERRFVGLKAWHLRKVRMSQLKDKYPGCPRLMFWIVIRIRDTQKFLCSWKSNADADSTEMERATD